MGAYRTTANPCISPMGQTFIQHARFREMTFL